jgi:DNA-binding NarL/FixJ family response regulator
MSSLLLMAGESPAEYICPMKLLIVNDDDAVRPRLAETLGEIKGLDVASYAPHEGRVIQHILELAPDVIVIDIQMPGGALDIIRTIKSVAHSPVVIALSISSLIQYRAACHKAGAEFFFDKTRELSLLSSAVTELQKELATPTERWRVEDRMILG